MERIYIFIENVEDNNEVWYNYTILTTIYNHHFQMISWKNGSRSWYVESGSKSHLSVAWIPLNSHCRMHQSSFLPVLGSFATKVNRCGLFLSYSKIAAFGLLISHSQLVIKVLEVIWTTIKKKKSRERIILLLLMKIISVKGVDWFLEKKNQNEYVLPESFVSVSIPLTLLSISMVETHWPLRGCHIMPGLPMSWKRELLFWQIRRSLSGVDAAPNNIVPKYWIRLKFIENSALTSMEFWPIRIRMQGIIRKAPWRTWKCASSFI